jgi:bacteriorhodopsin
MVLFGVTSGSVLQPTKWYIFGIGVIFGGVVFSNVIQCLSALYWDSQTDSIRLTSLMLAITFVVGWGIFPLNFVIGHSGLDLVSEQVYITNFVIGDLLSKNAWVAIAVLRNHQVEMHNLEQEMIESQHNQEQPKVRLALQQIEVQRFEQEGDWRNNPRLARRGSNSTLILNEVNSSSGRTPERQRQHSTRGVTPTMRT